MHACVHVVADWADRTASFLVDEVEDTRREIGDRRQVWFGTLGKGVALLEARR